MRLLWLLFVLLLALGFSYALYSDFHQQSIQHQLQGMLIAIALWWANMLDHNVQQWKLVLRSLRAKTRRLIAH